MTAYNFTQIKKVGKWEVRIDPRARYGYFEHDDEGEGGGLWFELDTDQPAEHQCLSLYDYDGRSFLPKGVATAIRELGHTVGPEFD